MAITLVEEVIEKEVTFLEGVEVEFVSLVEHGANRMPFRIIKTEGGDSRMMVVQSILAVKGVDLSKLSEDDMDWLSEANLKEGKDFGGYLKYDQTKLDCFQPESVTMVKVHDSGVWALAGSLKEGSTPDRAITLGAQDAEKAKKQSVMDTAVAVPVMRSFGSMFWDEMDSMMNVIFGAMNQAAADPKARKKVILGAVDAFKAFLEIGLNAVGGEAAKLDTTRLLATEKQKDQKEEESKLFKTMEEFKEAVAEVVKEVVSKSISDAIDAEKAKAEKIEVLEKEKEEKQKAETAAIPTPANGDKSGMEVVLAAVQGMQTNLDAAMKKWDAQLETEPAGSVTDDPPATPDPADKTKKSETRSVFAGLLLR